MVSLLQNNALLTLFLVAATGYFFGQLRLGGFSLGVAAVLFAGLAFGAIDERLALPELVPVFGLVLFVYSVGISSGPSFFASFRRRGLRDAGLAFGVLLLGATLTLLVHSALSLRPELSAGLFAGALTNTPALAAIVQQLKDASVRPELLSLPVVAYSVAYPIGVLGPILAVQLALQWPSARATATEEPANQESFVNLTFRVTRPEATTQAGAELLAEAGIRALFSRLERGDALRLYDGTKEPLHLGDLVSILGPQSEVVKAGALVGALSEKHLDLDRSVVDFRRIFVSSAEVAGRPLSGLGLAERFGAIVTRVRRGDVELLADPALQLELGDRVRVVAPHDRLGEVSRYFGDSYRSLAEIDVMTFGVGICAGLLLGVLPVPLPGGGTFRLGPAGGPLIAGLVLGRIGKLGPLVWTMPFSANLTLRQLGIVLFLAGVGTRSGHAFVDTLRQSGGLSLMGAGLLVTASVALGTVVVGRWLGIGAQSLAGMIAGIHTQPSALAFASERTQNDRPNAAYATVFPIATMTKIVAAQLLVAWLQAH